MNPCTSELAPFMAEHGYRVWVEDYDHTLFCPMQCPHTPRATVVNLLTLAGYTVIEPQGFTPPRYIYISHPSGPQ